MRIRVIIEKIGWRLTEEIVGRVEMVNQKVEMI